MVLWLALLIVLCNVVVLMSMGVLSTTMTLRGMYGDARDGCDVVVVEYMLV